jgi:hypothetical protein
MGYEARALQASGFRFSILIYNVYCIYLFALSPDFNILNHIYN